MISDEVPQSAKSDERQPAAAWLPKEYGEEKGVGWPNRGDATHLSGEYQAGECTYENACADEGGRRKLDRKN
jgi:hypothetical protein